MEIWISLDLSLAVDSTLSFNPEIEEPAISFPVCIDPGIGMMKPYLPGIRTFWGAEGGSIHKITILR